MAKRPGERLKLTSVHGAAGDVLGHQRQLAGLRQFHGARRVFRDERLDAVPNQLGQVMVIRILGMGDEAGGDVPALFK